MNQNLILYPVFAQAALTFGVGIWLGCTRFIAARRGNINPRYFALNRGAEMPEYLTKINNNYSNLLEIPILFYALVALLLITLKVEPAQVILAWLFTISRYAHTFIHTGYNNIIHRFCAFVSGVAVLMTMWGLFFVRMTLA